MSLKRNTLTGYLADIKPCLLITTLLLSSCVQTGHETVPQDNSNLRPEDQQPIVEAAPLAINRELCAAGEVAQVFKIVDGDTIDVRLKNGVEERVRFIGIDTPERGESCFQEASERNAILIANTSVRLIKDTSERDIYGRLVRYICNSSNVFVNAQLVSDGVAHAYRYRPDTRFADQFKALEREAQQAGRGCLHPNPDTNSGASGTACCKVCRNGKVCGNSCIPWSQSCHREPGCACQG
jgi:endonuclease YncB( thermonuclease family)